jgi:hypothetical protein
MDLMKQDILLKSYSTKGFIEGNNLKDKNFAPIVHVPEKIKYF